MRLPKRLWRILRSKRFHRFLLIGPFVGIVLATAFYATVNLYGRAKLEEKREELRARGFPLTQQDLLDENPSPNDDVLKHPAIFRSDSDIFGISAWDILEDAGYSLELLQGFTNVDPETGRATKLPTDVAPSEIRAALESCETIAAPIRDAIRRDSHSIRFASPTRVEGLPYEILSSHDYFRARAILALLDQDFEAARLEHLALNNLVRVSTRRGVSLMSLVVGLSTTNIVTTHYWEAAQHPTLPDGHLVEMDRWLESYDSFDPFLDTIRASLALDNIWYSAHVNSVVAAPPDQPEWFDFADSGTSGFLGNAAHWLWRLQPRGFVDLQMAETMQRKIDLFLVHPDGSPRTQFTTEDRLIYQSLEPESRVEDLLIRSAIPLLFEKQIEVQTRIRLCRLAIACERHHRATGHWPTDAHSLTPVFLKKPLVSPCSQTPLSIVTTSKGALTLLAPDSNLDDSLRWIYPAEPDESAADARPSPPQD